MKAILHERAAAQDERTLAEPPPMTGYGLLVDMDLDGLVALEIGGETRVPTVLGSIPWAAQGAVAYRVRWEPRDLVESQQEQPSLDHQVARKRAAQVVAQVVRTLHDAVGGEIADEAEFLVDPEDL